MTSDLAAGAAAPRPNVTRIAVRVVAAAGLFAAFGGLLSLMGWAADIRRLTDWLGNGISIQPNAAVAALSTGVALVLFARGQVRLVPVLGAVTGLLGAATLLQHVSGVNLGIDTLLTFGRPWGRGGTLAPGRMGLPGSLSWTFAGTAVALLTAGGRTRRLVTVIGTTLTVIGLLSLTGYLFRADSLYAVPAVTTIAVQTAMMVLAVGTGLVFTVPESHLARGVLDEGAAGVLIRRTIPFVIAVPILLGFLRLVGERAQLYDSAMGTAILVLTLIGLFCGVLWWAAAAVRDHELRVERTSEAAARQKDEFIALLAHELRNPLAPIRTSIALLRTSGSEDPMRIRCQDVIDRQAAHMGRLLDDLLDVSRLSFGRLTLQRGPVVLRDALDAAIEMNRPLIDRQRQDLSVGYPAEAIVLDADETRLGQILGNVLNNAAKYSGAQGRIFVSVRLEDGMAVIAVRDEGAGIDAVMLERMFDLFARSDDARHYSSGGLGIGLFLARRLVEMHGGTIAASSAGPGHGSEFVMRFPVLRCDSPQVAPIEPDVLSSTSLNRKVLVADDNVDGAEMLTTLFEGLGCEVRTVFDGQSAVREAETFLPDVAVLDIGMPLTDGYEACRQIRARRAGASGPLMVALTGWGQEADRRRSQAAGFDCHLVKPIDPAALVQLVRQSVPDVPALST
jgi:signal transduction histidine kinase/CheY-like chemotaxis protein